MRTNIVVARCGLQSLHGRWLAGGATRDWDLALCPFEDVPPEPASILPLRTVRGQKWSGLHALLTTWDGWRAYDYVWLPDDDLATDSETIDRLFSLSRAFDTTISAPALSEESFFSHLIAMRNTGFFARAVTFVEIMMPCFRRDVLERLLPTLARSGTGYGWGLDLLWPALLGYRNLVIFDDLAVHHTRPVGTIRDASTDALVKRELRTILETTPARLLFKTVGGYSDAMAFREADDGPFLLDYLAGYRYLIERHALYLKVLVDQQFEPTPGPAIV